MAWGGNYRGRGSPRTNRQSYGQDVRQAHNEAMHQLTILYKVLVTHGFGIADDAINAPVSSVTWCARRSLKGSVLPEHEAYLAIRPWFAIVGDPPMPSVKLLPCLEVYNATMSYTLHLDDADPQDLAEALPHWESFFILMVNAAAAAKPAVPEVSLDRLIDPNAPEGLI